MPQIKFRLSDWRMEWDWDFKEDNFRCFFQDSILTSDFIVPSGRATDGQWIGNASEEDQVVSESRRNNLSSDWRDWAKPGITSVRVAGVGWDPKRGPAQHTVERYCLLYGSASQFVTNGASTKIQFYFFRVLVRHPYIVFNAVALFHIFTFSWHIAVSIMAAKFPGIMPYMLQPASVYICPEDRGSTSVNLFDSIM
jgi:hypothetical protein